MKRYILKYFVGIDNEERYKDFHFKWTAKQFLHQRDHSDFTTCHEIRPGVWKVETEFLMRNIAGYIYDTAIVKLSDTEKATLSQYLAKAGEACCLT